MILRDSHFFNNRYKEINVKIDSDRWHRSLSKALVIPMEMSEEELKKLIEKSLGKVKTTIVKEEKVICLINPAEEVNFDASNAIDNLWVDGIEFNVAIYFSRHQTVYFTVIGDLKTTEKEISEFVSFLCLDNFKVHVDEITDCWVKRE